MGNMAGRTIDVRDAQCYPQQRKPVVSSERRCRCRRRRRRASPRRRHRRPPTAAPTAVGPTTVAVAATDVAATSDAVVTSRTIPTKSCIAKIECPIERRRRRRPLPSASSVGTITTSLRLLAQARRDPICERTIQSVFFPDKLVDNPSPGREWPAQRRHRAQDAVHGQIGPPGHRIEYPSLFRHAQSGR